MISNQGNINQQSNSCIFCSDQNQTSNIFMMMNQALLNKHTLQPVADSHLKTIQMYTNQVNPVSSIDLKVYINYKDLTTLLEDKQYLKRQYAQKQYYPKIQTLTQYYKYHQNLAKIVDLKIQKVMEKYYDCRSQHNYKKIKILLKKEQGLSISSLQDSQRDSDVSHFVEKKSKYSTLLHTNIQEPDTNSDSHILQEICKEMKKIRFKGEIQQIQIKEDNETNWRYFQDFIRKQEEKKSKIGGKNRLIKRQKIMNKVILERKQKNAYVCLNKNKKNSNQLYQNANLKIQNKNNMLYSIPTNNLVLLLDNKTPIHNYISPDDSILARPNIIHKAFKKEQNNKILRETYGWRKKEEDRKTQIKSRQRLKSRESYEYERNIERKKSLLDLKKGSTIISKQLKLKRNTQIKNRSSSTKNMSLPIKHIPISTYGSQQITLSGRPLQFSNTNLIGHTANNETVEKYMKRQQLRKINLNRKKQQFTRFNMKSLDKKNKISSSSNQQNKIITMNELLRKKLAYGLQS